MRRGYGHGRGRVGGGDPGWFGVLTRATIGSMSLIGLDEASRRLRVTGRSYLGLRQIPVARIVGSVDRTDDVDRAFPSPPGAVAPPARLPAGGVCQLVHTEQQRMLLEESGLRSARPHAAIEFTLLDGYTQLREIIDAHGYLLARRRDALPSREEVAGDWYDTVYRPGVEAAHRAGLPELYASWHSTDADLFLWLYQLRRDLRAFDAAVDFDAAARHALGLDLGRRRKREHLRNGRRPLPQEPD